MKSRTQLGTFFAATLVAAAGAAAQPTFHRAIGFESSEIAYEVERTSDGGYVTVGRIAPSSTAPADIYVVRYNNCGNPIWSRVIGSVNQQNDVGHSIRQTRDGGFIVAAETNSISQRLGIALIKLDGAGNPQWSRVYPGTPNVDSPAGVAVRELGDGSLVVIGRLQVGSGLQQLAGVLHRVDALGNPLFERRYILNVAGATGNLSFNDFVVVSDGFAVCGWLQDTPNTPMRAFFMRTDIAANPTILRTYVDFAGPNTADAITILPGGFGLAGRATNAAGAPTNMLTLRTTPAGNPLWARTTINVRPGFAAIDNDDDQFLVVAGSLTAGLDSALVRFDLAGNFNLGMRYGAGPNAITQAHDIIDIPGREGYVIAGNTTMQPGFGQEDLHLLRTDFGGRSGCRELPLIPPVTVPELQVLVPVVTPITEQGFQEFPIFVLRPESGNIAYCKNCCRADFNGDGVVDPDDLSDFIGCFFATPPCPLADVNGDMVVDPDDLSDFIGIFFAGC